MKAWLGDCKSKAKLDAAWPRTMGDREKTVETFKTHFVKKTYNPLSGLGKGAKQRAESRLTFTLSTLSNWAGVDAINWNKASRGELVFHNLVGSWTGLEEGAQTMCYLPHLCRRMPSLSSLLILYLWLFHIAATVLAHNALQPSSGTKEASAFPDFISFLGDHSWAGQKRQGKRASPYLASIT